MAGTATFLSGEDSTVGMKADFKGLLCLGPFSEMLPWEESEPVDNVQVAYREGILDSEKLGDFLLVKGLRGEEEKERELIKYSYREAQFKSKSSVPRTAWCMCFFCFLFWFSPL